MDLDQEIAKLTGEIGRQLQSERLNQDFGNITVLNLQLLAYIYFSDIPPKMRDIADNIGVTLPSLSVMAARLEDEGFVSRIHGTTDRRVIQLELTKKGRSLIESELRRSEQTIKAALKGFNEAEKRTVFKFLIAYAKSRTDGSAA